MPSLARPDINDSGTGVTDLWSAEKIIAYVAAEISTELTAYAVPIGYAGISVKDNSEPTAIAEAGTKVQFTEFGTNSPGSDATPDHTENHITIGTNGVYAVVIALVGESVSGAGSVFHADAYKNNGSAVIPPVHVHRSLSGGGSDKGSMSLAGIESMTAGDTVELWVENDTNGQNYVVSDASMFVVRLA